MNLINITDNKIGEFIPTFVTHGDLLLQTQNIPENKKNIRFQVEKSITFFTGRTDELKTLHSLLEESKLVVIHGLGGVGKSELARYYAINKKKSSIDANEEINYYDSVILINAENPQRLVESFHKLAKEIDIQIDKDVQKIYEYFEDKSCLLIFNDALQMEDIVDYLPQNISENKCIHVIITSQNIEWGTLKSISLDLLSETHSIDLINNILNPHYDTKKDVKHIKELSEVLQRLPFGIQQATTYIADIIQYKDPTYTVEQYLKAFDNEEEVLVNPELANPFPKYIEVKSDKTVYKTMLLTFDTIKNEKDYGLLALKILNLSALLAPDNILKEIFLPVLEPDEEKQFNKALRVIAKYSVIHLIDDRFHIHRLVQKISRLEQKRNKSLETYLESALNMVIQDNFINTTHNQSVLKIAQNRFGLILKFVVDANVQQIDNLLYSLSYNGHLEVLDFLLTSTESQRLYVNEKMLCAASQNGHIEIMKFIIQNGISINCKLPNSNSPIILAALNGQLDAVKFLVENGANVNDKGQDDISPLYNAVVCGHLDMIKYLCRKNANVNQPNKHLIAPLHISVEREYFSIVKFLINAKNANVNAKDSKGFTPLHYSIKKNHLEITKFLIQKGANVNEKNYENLSAFHIAIHFGYEEIVKLLFENKGSVNGEAVSGIFPLHIAAENGHRNIIDFLLKNGAKFTKTYDGKSPLDLATINGHQTIVEFFLNNPSISEIISETKYRCLYYAARYGRLNIVAYLINKCTNLDEIDKSLYVAVENGHIEIVKLLLNTNVKSKMKNGGISLHIASKYGFLAIVKYLFEQGVDLEYKNNKGFTALYIASTFGKLDIVEFLLENNASLDIQTNDGLTPLHGAAMRGHLKVVECLVENGAEIDALTKSHKSAVMMATDHIDIVDYLVKRGASVHL